MLVAGTVDAWELLGTMVMWQAGMSMLACNLFYTTVTWDTSRAKVKIYRDHFDHWLSHITYV